MAPTLFLPGYGNSGATHWQTLWLNKLPSAKRMDFQDWENPDADAWGRLLFSELATRQQPVILVAHSLGCLAAALHVEQHGPHSIAGLFLVAPPAPLNPGFPRAITGFKKLPMTRLGVPALVITSTNDPYSEPGFGARAAMAWGAQHHSIENAGHINAASGFGDWDEGLALLGNFVRKIESAA